MFPTELVTTIIGGVDTGSDLLNLRLVCRQFLPLATPSAFRRLEVKGTVTGAENLAQLQESDLSDFVHELEFIHDAEDQDTNASLAKAFSALTKFPKLENLVFNFSPEYKYGDLYDALLSDSLQHALIGALINNPLPPLLSSLSLVNVVSLYDELFKEASFRQLINKLKSFSLGTLTDPELDEYEYHLNPIYEKFWAKNVSEHIMTPSSSLVSLSIKSDRMAIYYAVRPCKGQKCLFPNLAHLALTDILLSNSVKEFILSHSDSLTHLELNECRIGVVEAPPDPTYTWKHLFSRIQEEMGHLVSFSFTHSLGLDDLCVSESGDYFVLTLGYDGWLLGWNEEDFGGYMTQEEVDDLFQQDGLALDSLKAAIKLRSNFESQTNGSGPVGS